MKEVVEIQSWKKLIKPATPTPPHLQTLNISSIDQLLPPFFIPVIFYFNDEQMMMQTSHTVRLLQESLSKVLTLYYPFAGRYSKEDSTICCHDQGVEFVVASVNCRVDELVQGEYDHLVIPTVHASGLTSTTPLLSVQVNEFTCGGLAIGVGLMHKLGDMFTFSKFMDAWATTCRLATSDQLPLPNFTLSSFLPPNSIKPPSTSSLAIATAPPSNYIMKRYTFTGEAIAKLKSQLNPSTDYTRVELVTALITRSLINIESSEPGVRTSFLLCHHMNLRSRTTLPIPDNSSGNFTMMVVAARQVENESRELQDLACFIRNSLRNAADEIGKVGEWAEIGRIAKGAFLKFKKRKMDGEKVNRVIFSSWCNFGLNQVDFGWGKPKLVSTVKGPMKLIDLMDSCCIGGDARGIDAWVCLEQDDMARFTQQPHILEYAISSLF